MIEKRYKEKEKKTMDNPGSADMGEIPQSLKNIKNETRSSWNIFLWHQLSMKW